MDHPSFISLKDGDNTTGDKVETPVDTTADMGTPFGTDKEPHNCGNSECTIHGANGSGEQAFIGLLQAALDATSRDLTTHARTVYRRALDIREATIGIIANGATGVDLERAAGALVAIDEILGRPKE